MHTVRNHLKHSIFVSVCRVTLEVERKGVFGPDTKVDWLTHRKKRAILRFKVRIVSDLQQAIRVHCFSIVPVCKNYDLRRQATTKNKVVHSPNDAVR